MVARSHPLPATLAEALLEGALDPGSSRCRRSGASARGPPRRQDGDDCPAAAVALQADGPWPARALAARRGGRRARLRGKRQSNPRSSARPRSVCSTRRPSGDLAPVARERLLAQAQRAGRGRASTAAIAPMRGPGRRAWLEDHARVRAAGMPECPASASSRCCRADVIGLYVLVPAGSEPWRALRTVAPSPWPSTPSPSRAR